MTTTIENAPEPTEEATRTPVLRSLVRQLGPALRLVLVATVVLGLVYPAVVWGISRVPGLSGHAEGSVSASGSSSLIGIDPVPANPGADPWFHLRPSASAPETATAGLGPADPSTSGGSNLATTADKLAQAVAERRSVIAGREGVAPAAVPDDAVTASASGVDPDISPDYAALQVPRVARVTGLPEAQVRALVAEATDGRVLGVLGEPTVNTSELNAALLVARPGLR
ncbi:potassium-transporting ATPase subunit C [Actinomycetospora sp. NBRC 106378]|uniref:potassium-transporting ATPase subunit C n=1 Tax=Actinomycetospora sp. NBRC 106378 TaxID=3032208 RepID=UPI0024A4FA32|nr:potassium-transporting ATPase subunit C [Actinomycetospora sp. NBRC 106378]GLZ53992.1 potassium-transporting ATPase KdpC subunit [Actinomycetospora sp. NBRC 106378]